MFLGAHHIEQGHPGVWAKQCAKIAWSEFEFEGPAGIPYQFHFVNGYKYAPYAPYTYPPQMGEPMGIVQLAEWQEASRDFAAGAWDEWANDRTSMWVDDLGPYLDTLDAAAAAAQNQTGPVAAAFVPAYLTRFDGQIYSAVVDWTPIAGHVLELLAPTFPTGRPTPSSWEFCGN